MTVELKEAWLCYFPKEIIKVHTFEMKAYCQMEDQHYRSKTLCTIDGKSFFEAKWNSRLFNTEEKAINFSK